LGRQSNLRQTPERTGAMASALDRGEMVDQFRIVELRERQLDR
jgi:hypothetical protein